LSSRAEVAERLEGLRSDHPKARHHCFAYRLGAKGEDYRISDDGEPSGSAGQPIYNQLLSFEVTNLLVVVIRYFGGTKLGIPGLINAYKTAAYEALKTAEIEERFLSAFYQVSTSYDHSARLMNTFKERNIDVLDVRYSERVHFSLSLPVLDHEAQLNLALANGLNLPAVEMLSDLDVTELEVKLTDIES
jgi:uncharacterized YigZ family protein